MKYIKSILIIIIFLLIINILLTILNYFNLLNNNIKITSYLIPFIISGLYIGKNSKNKVHLEGLKTSLIFILISLLLIILLPNASFSIKTLINYLLVTIVIIISSIIGKKFIKKKK